MTRRGATIRNSSGSLFLLMIALLGLLLAVVGIAVTISAAFVAHQKLQEQAENTVMNVTKQLN
jgi:Putative Flp pilus-assembly TadE/G-like